nr:MAG TPA: hypothetical protein [Caudoviricetes sp.]
MYARNPKYASLYDSKPVDSISVILPPEGRERYVSFILLSP